MRYRIKHVKIKELAFLSHLDLMLTMQRALRRARLPFSLTKGFNPIPKFSYGQPVAVGTESIAEYFDLYLTRAQTEGEILSAFNNVLPKSLRVIQVKSIPPKEPSLMAKIKAARHYLWLKTDDRNWVAVKQFADTWLEKEHIEIITRKSIPLDIRPLLIKMDWLGWNGQWALLDIVSLAGSQANLNIQDFYQYLNNIATPNQESFGKIMRTEVFIDDCGELKTPLGLEVKLL